MSVVTVHISTHGLAKQCSELANILAPCLNALQCNPMQCNAIASIAKALAMFLLQYAMNRAGDANETVTGRVMHCL